MELPENINKSELIQILRFYMSKESNGWFIIGFKPIYNMNSISIDLKTAELTCDQVRNIHYHRIQKSLESPSKSTDFLSWLRDFRIQEINDNSIDSFSYNDRLKIELLKIESHFHDNESRVISKENATYEYIKNLKKGDRILYKNMPGIITYKHKGDDIKFTVNIKDNYHKYIPGSQLIKRVKKDLSHIEIPIEIQKLTTMELLKMLKKSHNLYKGFAPDAIKAELNKREHIKTKPK